MSPLYIPRACPPEEVQDDPDDYYPGNVQVMFEHYCPKCKRLLCLVTYQGNVLTTRDYVKLRYYAAVQCISFGQVCDFTAAESQKYLENALAAVNETMQRFGDVRDGTD